MNFSSKTIAYFPRMSVTTAFRWSHVMRPKVRIFLSVMDCLIVWKVWVGFYRHCIPKWIYDMSLFGKLIWKASRTKQVSTHWCLHEDKCRYHVRSVLVDCVRVPAAVNETSNQQLLAKTLSIASLTATRVLDGPNTLPVVASLRCAIKYYFSFGFCWFNISGPS